MGHRHDNRRKRRIRLGRRNCTMKVWLTADWHLGEDRMELMGRPFGSPTEHITHLLCEHNKLVKDDDLVFVLGDVCYQKTPERLKHVQAFAGRKILVRGNHD